MKKYIKLNDKDYNEKILKKIENINRKKGVYILYLFENGEPTKINRFLNNDVQGILYIGRATKGILRRLNSLKQSIINNSNYSQDKPKEKGHKILSNRFYRVRKSIDINDLYINIIPTDRPKHYESKLLEEYASKYGELPPFNANFGNYEKWELYH